MDKCQTFMLSAVSRLYEPLCFALFYLPSLSCIVILIKLLIVSIVQPNNPVELTQSRSLNSHSSHSFFFWTLFTLISAAVSQSSLFIIINPYDHIFLLSLFSCSWLYVIDLRKGRRRSDLIDQTDCFLSISYLSQSRAFARFTYPPFFFSH